jgi:hypothetical protein
MAAGASLAAMLLLVLAACGGNGVTGGGGGIEPQATGSRAASPASSLGSGGGRFCDAARKFESDQLVIHQAERASAQGGSAAGSAAVLQAARDSEAALATMGAVARGSLKSDLPVVISGWKPFFATLIRARGDMSKVPATVERNMQVTVTQPQFLAVDSYEARACHFHPSAH